MVRSGATSDSAGLPGSPTCASTRVSNRLRAPAAGASTSAQSAASAIATVARRVLVLDLSKDLGGRALAGPDRPVHVAVPVGRGLGAGPVDPPDGRADRR